jgi:hypothetical protein
MKKFIERTWKMLQEIKKKEKRKFLSGIVNALCSNGFSVDDVAIQTGSGILPRKIEHCNVLNNQIVNRLEGEDALTVS